MSPTIYPIESDLMQREMELAIPRILDRCIRLDNGCLIWQGAQNGKGYGEVRIRNRKLYVHKLILWAKLGGDNEVLSKEAIAMHSCDTPGCCEKDHLSKATQSDNLRDSVAKGRMAPPTPESRLSLDDVEHIRRLHEEGYSNRQIGAVYNMNHGNISRIVRGLSHAG